MKRTLSTLLCAGLVVGLAFTPVHAEDEAPAGEGAAKAETLSLKINLATGDKVPFRQLVSIDTKMDMGGMEVGTKIEMNQDYTVKCLSADETGTKIEMSFGRVWGSFDNPMLGTIDFDSSKAAEETGNPMLDSMAKSFTVMADKTLGMRLDPNGEIADVTGVEALLDAAAGDDPMMREMLKSTLDADKLREQFKSSFAALPKEPVAVGATWTASNAFDAMPGMSVKTNFEHKLGAMDADSASYTTTGTLSMDTSGSDEPSDPSDPSAMLKEMMREAKISDGKVTGSTTVSRKDGLPISITSEITMTAEIPSPVDPSTTSAISYLLSTKLSRRALTDTSAPPPAKKEGGEGAQPEGDESGGGGGGMGDE